jgi:hypothetical protein
MKAEVRPEGFTARKEGRQRRGIPRSVAIKTANGVRTGSMGTPVCSLNHTDTPIMRAV